MVGHMMLGHIFYNSTGGILIAGCLCIFLVPLFFVIKKIPQTKKNFRQVIPLIPFALLLASMSFPWEGHLINILKAFIIATILMAIFYGLTAKLGLWKDFE